jgi:hypothetical protein
MRENDLSGNVGLFPNVRGVRTIRKKKEGEIVGFLQSSSGLSPLMTNTSAQIPNFGLVTR